MTYQQGWQDAQNLLRTNAIKRDGILMLDADSTLFVDHLTMQGQQGLFGSDQRRHYLHGLFSTLQKEGVQLMINSRNNPDFLVEVLHREGFIDYFKSTNTPSFYKAHPYQKYPSHAIFATNGAGKVFDMILPNKLDKTLFFDDDYSNIVTAKQLKIADSHWVDNNRAIHKGHELGLSSEHMGLACAAQVAKGCAQAPQQQLRQPFNPILQAQPHLAYPVGPQQRFSAAGISVSNPLEHHFAQSNSAPYAQSASPMPPSAPIATPRSTSTPMPMQQRSAQAAAYPYAPAPVMGAQPHRSQQRVSPPQSRSRAQPSFAGVNEEVIVRIKKSGGGKDAVMDMVGQQQGKHFVFVRIANSADYQRLRHVKASREVPGFDAPPSQQVKGAFKVPARDFNRIRERSPSPPRGLG